MNFETWFEIYTHHLTGYGWSGPIDTDSARQDFENDMQPEDVAESLAREFDLIDD